MKMYKFNSKLFLVGVGSMLTAMAVNSAQAVTEPANGFINLLAAVSITENNGMEFGIVSAPTSGSNTVVVSPAGVRTIGGAGDGALVSGTTPQAADYDIVGDDLAVVDITVDTIVNPGTGMALGTFTATHNGGAITLGTAATTLVAGADNIDLGATMTVDSTVTPGGPYTGTFNFNVNYN